ncbi:MAG: hypothetical protein ABFS10_10955 [Bacteroidota bacterium]
MRVKYQIIITGLFISVTALSQQYRDTAYLQDDVDKFEIPGEAQEQILMQVQTDRNNTIQVLSTAGLLHPWEKELVPDLRYRPLSDQHIIAIDTYRDQFVYLTDQAVLSNGWAGRLYVEHHLEHPSHFAMGDEFSFLIAEKGQLIYFENCKKVWEKPVEGFDPVDLLYDTEEGTFLALSEGAIYAFNPDRRKLKEVYSGEDLTALAITDNKRLLVGTGDGIITLDAGTYEVTAPMNNKLPCSEITCIEQVNGERWFGSARGAFKLRSDGKYDYYASKRWLVDDHVIGISGGPDHGVLVLTKNGLSKINFKAMTLAEKARYFQKIQRLRHIRYGFSSEVNLQVPGDLSTAVLTDTDNDGLWTSMYLAGELFRYGATGSADALQNAYEAFGAMERLTEISGIDGFPARTYEIDSYQSSDTDPNMPEEEKIWRLTEDERWRWKSTTSSDESCGHFFVYALFAELVPDQAWKDRAIHQIKIEMDHIIENDWYLVTWNGKITQWGRWNPEYVNSFPVNVGDRRLNSTLILAFLQTAYHFTGEKIYKEKAYELMDQHGYLENVLRPASVIGHVEGELLSDSWNHSDDEMYFLTIPALIRYAFTDELKQQYLETVKSHWEIERSEKNPLWNFLYGYAGGAQMDLEESVWWLREFPMDLISWSVENSHRKDLTRMGPNFREQEYNEVLPRDERPMHLHNGAYRNNGGSAGRREYPPYIYLFPYWVGRYMDAIVPAE